MVIVFYFPGAVGNNSCDVLFSANYSLFLLCSANNYFIGFVDSFVFCLDLQNLTSVHM